MSNELDPIETIQEPARRAGDLSRAVAAQIEEQRSQQATDAAMQAAYEEPAFDKRKGESNFGRRVAAKIALANQ